MKTLVTYVSNTGNTRKVAEAIYGEVPGEKEFEELSGVESLEAYDLVFIGFPINAGGPNPTAREFMENNVAGKTVAVFTTHGAPEDHEDVAGWLAACREAATGADLLGLFDCQGEVDQAIIDFLLKADDPKLRVFGEAGASGEGKGQPDESRIERAREFAREVVAKAGA